MTKVFFKSLLMAWAFLGTITLFAQNPTGYYVDAARLSNTFIGGTARFQGMGGAGTALGADLSMPALNPAGLGLYRKSEVALGMGLGFSGTNSNYLGEENKDNRSYFYFPNFGIALNASKDDIEPGAWRGGTFAITYNRINDFQNQVFLSGTNNSSTINTGFVDVLNRSGYDDYDLSVPPGEYYSLEELIFMTYLSEYDYVRGEFYNPFDSTAIYYDRDSDNMHDETEYLQHPSMVPNYQEQLITTNGGQNQIDVAYGGNVSDRFYLGASLGIVRVRHSVTKDYYEAAEGESDIRSLTFNQTLETKGTGFNFKVGFIARPVDALRIGLSLQTPTAYYLTENYQYYIHATFADDYVVKVPGGQTTPKDQDNNTIPLEFKYRVTTPAIVRGGLAYFIGKLGFISADVEYIPYGMTSLNNKDDRSIFRGDNRLIKNNFEGALNYKVGAEVRNNIWRYRVGYAKTASPLKALDGYDRSVTRYSAGVGIRLPEFYFDAALTHSRSQGFEQPYTLPSGGGPTAEIDFRNTGFVLSFGTFF